MFARCGVSRLLIFVSILLLIAIVSVLIFDFWPYMYGVMHAAQIVNGGTELMDLVALIRLRQKFHTLTAHPEFLQQMHPTLLLVTHDKAEILGLAQRLFCFQDRTG